MHGSPTVLRAFEFAHDGLAQTEIARRLGISQKAVSRWLSAGLDETLNSPMRHRAASDCPDECNVVHSTPSEPYAYLLGQYLGDGSIVHTKRDVYRLTVTCCAAYPGIVAECAAALGAVLPDNAIGRRERSGAICQRRLKTDPLPPVEN